MATDVTLPALGESVTEGTVTQWLKAVGDTVAVDEALLEISTDKVDTEIPSPVAGVLLEIKAEEDETVEVGAILAVIGEEGESTGDSGDDSAGADDQAEAPEPTEAAEDGAAVDTDSDGADASTPADGADDVDTQGESSDADEPPSAQEEADAAETAPAPQPEAEETSEGTAVTLPALGESVTEGTVTQWLKSVGDEVAVDEALLEISTDKVDTEIPSPVAGTLTKILVDEDETVEVGAQLAIIGGSGGGDAPAEPEAEKAPAPAASSGDTSGDSYVTPIVRKLAKQHGVDLATVTGTGVGGRIRKQDVLDAAANQPAPEPEQAPASDDKPTSYQPAASDEKASASSPAPAAPSEPSPLRGKTEKISRLRKVIASRMVESLQTSAQLTQVHEVDVTEVARLRAKHKNAFAEREGVKLTFLPFFAKAAIEALKAYPQLNAQLDVEAGTVTYPTGEHLGVAVDTERGLLVPTVKDAGDLSIAGLARKIADVAERTRTNQISPDEISGATFTVTNLGSNGALFDTPIINQPQVGILGIGAVVKRPVVITDEKGGEGIAVRSIAYLALTYDHRLVDGADAGRFLTAVKQRLEAGVFEAELGS